MTIFANTVAGFIGLSPIVEAAADLDGGEETPASGVVKVFEAAVESAGQFNLQLFYLTVITWRVAWETSSIVVISAAISYVSLAIQFATYHATPAGGNRVLGIRMNSHSGTKQATTGYLFYFASDLALRSAAVSVLGYASQQYAWWIAGAYLLVNAVIACVTMQFVGGPSRHFGPLFGSTIGFLTAFIPLNKLTGCAHYAVWEFLLSTTACVAAIVAGLYWPGLPHPHVDPTFIRNAVGLAATAGSTKIAAFVWYVYPMSFMKHENDYDLLSA